MGEGPVSTYVIMLWTYGTYPDTMPADILGPFTKAEADRVAATLDCEHWIKQIRTDPPEWALPTTDAPEWTI